MKRCCDCKHINWEWKKNDEGRFMEGCRLKDTPITDEEAEEGCDKFDPSFECVNCICWHGGFNDSDICDTRGEEVSFDFYCEFFSPAEFV